MIRGKRLIADTSLVEADASIDSMVERDNGDLNARPHKQYEKRYHDFKEGKKQRKLSTQTHVSTTDPDATLVCRPDTYRKMYYKVYYLEDARNRMIVECLKVV